MSASHPLDGVADRWEQVVEDMEVTAEQYRNAGWETVELHPGDVTVLGPDDDAGRVGLDVVVPDSEFETVDANVATRTFDSYEVLRASAEGVVFLVTILEDDAGELALFVPGYYGFDDAETLRAAAADRGALHTNVRRLESDEWITFEHDDPEPFFPAPDEDDE